MKVRLHLYSPSIDDQKMERHIFALPQTAYIPLSPGRQRKFGRRFRGQNRNLHADNIRVSWFKVERNYIYPRYLVSSGSPSRTGRAILFLMQMLFSFWFSIFVINVISRFHIINPRHVFVPFHEEFMQFYWLGQ